MVEIQHCLVNVPNVLEEIDDQFDAREDGGDVFQRVGAPFATVFYYVTIWVINNHRVDSSHIKHSDMKVSSINEMVNERERGHLLFPLDGILTICKLLQA